MADPQVLTTLRRKQARDVGTEAFADGGQDRGGPVSLRRATTLDRSGHHTIIILVM